MRRILTYNIGHPVFYIQQQIRSAYHRKNSVSPTHPERVPILGGTYRWIRGLTEYQTLGLREVSRRRIVARDLHPSPTGQAVDRELSAWLWRYAWPPTSGCTDFHFCTGRKRVRPTVGPGTACSPKRHTHPEKRWPKLQFALDGFEAVYRRLFIPRAAVCAYVPSSDGVRRFGRGRETDNPELLFAWW